MIFNKERVLKNRRLCQAIFGVSREEIESLLPIFSQCLIAYRYNGLAKLDNSLRYNLVV